jgi:hypothetical protein
VQEFQNFLNPEPHLGFGAVQRPLAEPEFGFGLGSAHVRWGSEPNHGITMSI